MRQLTPDIMSEFVLRATKPYALTAREHDVINSLLRGKVTTREIADALGISESTVSNHIDNISSKTGLGGKSEILAFLVQKLCRFVEDARYFIRAPHVLVLDDNVDIADILVDHYRERGCQAMAAYRPDDKLIEAIATHRIDLIIVDVLLGVESGLKFLERVRDRLKFLPASIVITASPNVKESDAFDAGAVAWMKKPLDAGRLFELSVNAFINADRHAGRRERTPLRTPVSLASGGEAHTAEISSTGMMLETLDSSALPVGTSLKFELELPGKRMVTGSGVTIWSSPGLTEGAATAVGVRFDELLVEDESFLKDLVRTKNILSFLPVEDVFEKPAKGPEAPRPKKKGA